MANSRATLGERSSLQENEYGNRRTSRGLEEIKGASRSYAEVSPSEELRNAKTRDKTSNDRWMDEVEDAIPDKSKNAKNKDDRSEKPVITPIKGQDIQQILDENVVSKNYEQPRKSAKSSGLKKTRPGDPYASQLAMDFDSIKSGNQVGAAANNREAVMQTLDVYGTDGFDSLHNEVAEDIGAEQQDLDDIDAILEEEAGNDTGFESEPSPLYGNVFDEDKDDRDGMYPSLEDGMFGK